LLFQIQIKSAIRHSIYLNQNNYILFQETSVSKLTSNRRYFSCFYYFLVVYKLFMICQANKTNEKPHLGTEQNMISQRIIN